MTVQYDGLIKMLCRKFKGVYTRAQITEKVERDGANSLDPSIKYLGYGIWEVQE